MTMRYIRTIAVLLCGVLLLGLLSGCGGENSIVGEWSAETRMSLLGIDQEGDEMDAEVTFSFRENGSGSMEVDFPDPLSDPDERGFRYSIEGDRLLVEYDDGQRDEFAFHLTPNTLKLDGRAKLELRRDE